VYKGAVRFTETQLRGAFVIDIERIADERGFFARTWCRDELRRAGLVVELAQCSISYNRKARTLRGMHYQADPFPETKIVSCARGRMLDVIVDLRRDSPTFCQSFALTMSGQDGQSLYVPAGFAHGFVTLEDDTIVQYCITQSYHADLARGVRWDDPAFNIEWPKGDALIMSARDQSYAPFDRERDGFFTKDVAKQDGAA
jgi:dTDP-4-dehydrorhamnose 3,5-epimerase